VFYLKTGEAEALWFAVTCIFVAGYDLTSAGLYSAQNYTDGMFWQRQQFAILNAVAVSFLWFFWSFLKLANRWIPAVISAVFILLLFMGIFLDASAVLSVDVETPRTIGVTGNIQFELYEGSPGTIYIIELGAIFMGLLFLAAYSILSRAEQLETGKRKNVFIVVFCVFSLCAVNDILVGMEAYNFIYLVEYGYLLIILFMAYILLDKHFSMMDEVKELNLKLEEKVTERTKSLQQKTEEVEVLSGLLPICSSCKKIRDDDGYWNQLEVYITKHSQAKFTHGICGDCTSKLYGKEEWFES